MGDSDRSVPSIAFTRIALIVLVPLAVVFGLNRSVWAAVTLKAWTSGETLTAADLNANFNALKDELAGQSARVQNAANPASTLNFTSSFGDVFPPYTFAAPVAREYIVHIDVHQYFTAVVGARGISEYQLVVNGVAQPLQFQVEGTDTNLRWGGSFRVLVMMNAGNNILQLRARNTQGSGIIDVASRRVFTIE